VTDKKIGLKKGPSPKTNGANLRGDTEVDLARAPGVDRRAAFSFAAPDPDPGHFWRPARGALVSRHASFYPPEHRPWPRRRAFREPQMRARPAGVHRQPATEQASVWLTLPWRGWSGRSGDQRRGCRRALPPSAAATMPPEGRRREVGGGKVPASWDAGPEGRLSKSLKNSALLPVYRSKWYVFPRRKIEN
jgi:hypothetical protein